jgi:succinyl-CoA synthetase alpha subunit
MKGEIGGASEENPAEFLRSQARRGRNKPMAGFISGTADPP